jgi:hypothetical protein
MFNKKDAKSFALIYPVAEPKNFGAGFVLNF